MHRNLYWTRQAQKDPKAIRDLIALDAPATASAYVRKLRESVGRLRQFPFSGEVVPEFGREEIREVLRGDYRLIYRVSDGRVDILTVFHGARILDERDL